MWLTLKGWDAPLSPQICTQICTGRFTSPFISVLHFISPLLFCQTWQIPWVWTRLLSNTHMYITACLSLSGLMRHSVTSSEEGSHTNYVKSKVALIFISGFQWTCFFVLFFSILSYSHECHLKCRQHVIIFKHLGSSAVWWQELFWTIENSNEEHKLYQVWWVFENHPWRNPWNHILISQPVDHCT